MWLSSPPSSVIYNSSARACGAPAQKRRDNLRPRSEAAGPSIAALAAESSTTSDPRGDRLRRVHDGGGGIQGVKAQLKRQQGILRRVRAARLSVEQATASHMALRRDALAHLRLRAEFRLESALATERALYTPTSATYLARHDRSLHRALLRPFLGPPEQAAAVRASTTP